MSLNYSKEQLDLYASSLSRVASLSNLFSESSTPFIHYRATEYLYARALGASNLARSDITIDAKRGDVGIGLKTFVYKSRPKFEKIAEFNKAIESFDTLTPEDKIFRISTLRNERIEFAGRVAGVTTFIYHCIARLPGKLFVFEVPMPRINIETIRVTEVRGRNISFTDGSENYRFNSSKSTLFKEFYSEESLFEKPVIIYDDPFTLLNTLELNERPTEFGIIPIYIEPKNFVVLPLYGYQNGEPYVFEKSGLNQWNAGGRERNLSEVYIPINSKVHAKSPDFFPSRDTPFELNFPNSEKMTVKLCQDKSKALMSQRNADLGEWLLRDVLNLKEGELLTYQRLAELGIGAVEISKTNGQYSIDFKSPEFYEDYINS